MLVASSSLLGGCTSLRRPGTAIEPMRACGPASKYVPTIKAAFVRRKEDYGMWWPGAVYDGRSARRKYTAQMIKTAKSLGVKLDLRPEPIYSGSVADAWLARAKAAKVDGLIVMVHDRQQHSWPTAYKASITKSLSPSLSRSITSGAPARHGLQKAIETAIPTVIFSPVGTSFTTNTESLADRAGCVVYSTDDFSCVAYGMKMLKAGAKLRRSRCVVLMGDKRYDQSLTNLGITLRHIPAKTYLDEYHGIPATDEVLAMTEQYLRRARRRIGASRQDVVNGIKGYLACRNILEREKADAITMDCLGAIGRQNSKVSLPCISWSRMLDDGIPAACEADYGAVASHIIVQYLFDRPGFQQDPVADTANDAIIGAHCTCPTRLNGFDQPPEPFDLVHHHANRDATARVLWPKGQRITSIDVLPGGDDSPRPGISAEDSDTEVLISAGTVLGNVSVPPAGGCVVSVRVKFDGDQNVLSFPGFHQLFFYGDYKRQLLEFCQLFGLKARVV